MIQPEDSAPAMPQFQDKTDMLDLSDLQRDAGALLSEIERAGETIISESAAPMPASAKPAHKKHHTHNHNDHADPSAMTDAAIDAAPEDQPEIPPEIAQAPDFDESPEQVADAAAVAGAVDDLIDDALSAVEAIGVQASDEATPPGESDEAAVAELAAEVERLTAEAASLIESVEVESAESVESEEAHEAAEPAVEHVIEQDVAESPSAHKPIEAGEGAGVMASLDAAIESEAEALEDDLDALEGDFETPDEVARGADHSAETLEEDTEYFDDEPINPATVVIESALGAEADDDPDHEESRTSAPAAAAATAASSRETKSSNAAPAAAQSVASDDARPAWRVALDRLTSAETRDMIVRRVLRPLAAPLLRVPPATRDTIGWIGVNTVFIAVCLWLYLTLR